MKTNHLRKQSGSSLVVVISVLATLMVVVGVAAEYTWTVNRHVQRSNTQERAVAAADGCIDILFSNWRAICSQPGNVTIPQTTNDFNGVNGQPAIPLPTPSQFNLPSVTNFAKRGTNIDPKTDEAPGTSDYDASYTISNYKLVAVDAEWNALSWAGATPEPIFGQIAQAISSGAILPTTPLVYNYVASADVTLPALGPTGTVVAKVRRVFQKQRLSPWNFAIFYADPLEIQPGDDFTVTGWVHTNSDLYTGHNLLTFADKVTYGSDWFVGFKPGDGTHPETPTAPHYPGNLPPAREQAMQPFGLDSTSIFNINDANPNNDSYRELIEPPTATPDPLSGSRYWDQSSVIISVNASGNSVTIGKPHINALTGVADGVITAFTSSSTGNDLALYNMFTTSGAITTNQFITDTREGATANNMRLVTLDLSKILNNTVGLIPTYKASAFNGILYIYDSSATTHTLQPDGSVNQNPTNPVSRGVRLTNGSKIPATGLTVVSANPVYIQGDYNTGRNYDGSTKPPSNNTVSDPTTPQVPGYQRGPCSVIADAVNILSNSWGTASTASNTTINAAIVSGIVPSAPVGGDGSYSGGAENFPRFLEDWTGAALTYYGSMVELYKSQQSIGRWTCCTVYSPPKRQWYFDNNFKTNPPPGSLMLYSYIKGKWSVL